MKSERLDAVAAEGFRAVRTADLAKAAYVAHMTAGEDALSEEGATLSWERAINKWPEVYAHWRGVAKAVLEATRVV